jgi:hypothetical protein
MCFFSTAGRRLGILQATIASIASATAESDAFRSPKPVDWAGTRLPDELSFSSEEVLEDCVGNGVRIHYVGPGYDP